MSRFRHRTGLTLVELLVVVGILTILAAIAVPVFVRYSALTSGDLQRTARGLQEMVRAAKIYASTYNTEAAIVYTVQQTVDSVTGLPVRYIDGYAVARRMTPDEQFRAGLSGDKNFTPILESEGQFRRMPEGMCLTLMLAGGGGVGDLNALDLYSGLGQVAKQQMGLVEVQLVDADGFLIEPRVSDVGAGEVQLGFLPNTTGFPAHRFDTAGNLKTDAAKQRFTLHVTPTPGEPEDVRYVSSGDGTALTPFRLTLQLYATLGRIKMET